MKALALIPFALLTVVTAQQPSDITIKTRSTYGPHVNGAIETITFQVKGSRQRHVRRTEIGNTGSSFAFTTIAQCDMGQIIEINEATRLYAVEPVRSLVTLPAHAILARRPVEDTRAVVEVRTIDAVDTGERRAYGLLVARHVVTTITVEREDAFRNLNEVRDGWYVDLPWPPCQKPGDTATFVALGMVISTGDVVGSTGRVETRIKGRAKTGFPIEEHDRRPNGAASFERTTQLVEFSEVPLATSLFEIPEGYKPALQLPFGVGHDLSRPDTVWNRASAMWTLATSWTRQWQWPWLR
jgi:hypothetical protein